MLREDGYRWAGNMLEEASPGAVKDSGSGVPGNTDQDVHQSAETVSVLAEKKERPSSLKDAIPALETSPRRKALASLCWLRKSALDWACFLPGSAVAYRHSLSWHCFLRADRIPFAQMRPRHLS